jgi:hypothetical protein
LLDSIRCARRQSAHKPKLFLSDLDSFIGRQRFLFK